MRVVLTGGAGFVGSHLAEALVQRGDDVLILDNLATGSRANVLPLEQSGGVVFLEHDVCQPLEVDFELDAVLHLASPASPPDYMALPLATLDVGSIGTRRMLDLAGSAGARFLMASTSEVYGDALEHPQRESYWGNVNPIGPRSVYDEAKRCAEAYTMAFHRAGLDTKIARIFNTYGPRMRPDDGRAIPSFVSQALDDRALTVYGDGLQTRSLCYVDDIVRGLIALLDSDEHRPVNLGQPDEITVLALARKVAAACGRSPDNVEYQPLPEDDPQRRCPDITRAREVLGWEPVITLDDGIARTLAWFRTSRALEASGEG